eukprot:11881309-Prorocentrum_lima.AAC.1
MTENQPRTQKQNEISPPRRNINNRQRPQNKKIEITFGGYTNNHTDDTGNEQPEEQRDTNAQP